MHTFTLLVSHALDLYQTFGGGQGPNGAAGTAAGMAGTAAGTASPGFFGGAAGAAGGMAGTAAGAAGGVRAAGAAGPNLLGLINVALGNISLLNGLSLFNG